MAFHDWNLNGKKDFEDDFIEFQIIREAMNKQDNLDSKYNNKNKTSRSGTSIPLIGGFLLATGIGSWLSGGEDISMVLIIILWIICGAGIAAFLNR